MNIKDLENKKALNENLRNATRLASQLTGLAPSLIFILATGLKRQTGYNWLNKQFDLNLEQSIKLLKFLIEETHLTEEEMKGSVMMNVK